MKEELFNELTQSIKQAGKIRHGKLPASKRTVIEDPDVAQIRRKYNMNQQEFSALLGISVGTLRNWEQGRRKPHGPAKVLLKIAEKKPKAILESLSS
ncbi:NadS family protein [Natronogracilivirga saccharolytica]|uniref:Helix-turn-helix domain-containing protein n=1 Tax=Natronogracilivirga saccharolytica TaxID=2812953 RepID=A0A8J7S9A0_9BACT|nr:NadS family protein [Natronogracilivirga saccharolytica]MBP3192713.1 helix-turn-helix domain-containing protein [Natronogracilivirga saccharolytica]